MSDEKDKAVPAPQKPRRKYKFLGSVPKNPMAYNLYEGNVKLQPWVMTDEEVEATIATHPHLARYWEKID